MLNLFHRLKTFLRGIVMGTSDVIPGVSGGTMALVLGIYERLIRAIENVDHRWFRDGWYLLTGGDNDASRVEIAKRMELPFLVPLGAGIVTAILVGSQFIPTLLANYPELVRAFFFGLIIASLWIPLRRAVPSSNLECVFVVLLLFVGMGTGWYVTDPGRTLLPEQRWVSVESNGKTLERLLRRQGGALPAYQTFWHDRNRGFRRWLRRNKPEQYRELESLRDARNNVEASSRKNVLKARSELYHRLRIPAEADIYIPRLRYDYTLFAGFLAVSAMILPGISGSYILLILGVYFFVLNLLKGFVDGLLNAEFLGLHALYILLFILGALAGLAVLSRILSRLLDRWPEPTMALLAGLMVGCLRGVWPFRRVTGDVIQNMPPPGWSDVTALATLSAVAGLLAMAALYAVGAVDEGGDSP